MDAQEVVLILNALPMTGIVFGVCVIAVVLPMIYFMSRYEYSKLTAKAEIVREMTTQNRPLSEIQQAVKMLDQ